MISFNSIEDHVIHGLWTRNVRVHIRLNHTLTFGSMHCTVQTALIFNLLNLSVQPDRTSSAPFNTCFSHCIVLRCAGYFVVYNVLRPLYCILYCSLASRSICSILYGTLSTFLNCTVLKCTVLKCAVLNCTVLHCTVLNCNKMFCTVLLCSTLLHCTTILYCNVWQYHTAVIQYYTVVLQYYTAVLQYYTTVLQNYTVLYYICLRPHAIAVL